MNQEKEKRRKRKGRIKTKEKSEKRKTKIIRNPRQKGERQILDTIIQFV